MGRRLRQTVTALATTALAIGAIVVVFYALPDGTDSAADAAATTTSTVTSPPGPVQTTGTVSAPPAVSVPALDKTLSSTAHDGAATSADATSADAGPDVIESTAGTAQTNAATATTSASTDVTASADSVTAPASPAAPNAPAAPSAPTAPAVTTAPKTTAAKTTAPQTTAPKTTAAKTTAPKTTAPQTTAPKTTAAPIPNFGIPVSIGNARQVVTVTAATQTSTTGTLRAWQKQPDGRWTVVYGPVKAYLGTQGIGAPKESASRTPQGTYTLTEAFGRLADPGTALPYHVTSANDWWVSDTRAATYNTLQTCAPTACPFNTKVSERLHYITPYYDYAVVMDVNRSPVVAGGGSAFFLHVSVGSPTAGCVAIDKATLVKIMRWLDPAQHPRIAVGVG